MGIPPSGRQDGERVRLGPTNHRPLDWHWTNHRPLFSVCPVTIKWALQRLPQSEGNITTAIEFRVQDGGGRGVAVIFKVHLYLQEQEEEEGQGDKEKQ